MRARNDMLYFYVHWLSPVGAANPTLRRGGGARRRCAQPG